MAYGLYEVVRGSIWQVRGFDLANISFVKSDTGWIVFDPLDGQGNRQGGKTLAMDSFEQAELAR